MCEHISNYTLHGRHQSLELWYITGKVVSSCLLNHYKAFDQNIVETKEIANYMADLKTFTCGIEFLNFKLAL